MGEIRSTKQTHRGVTSVTTRPNTSASEAVTRSHSVPSSCRKSPRSVARGKHDGNQPRNYSVNSNINNHNNSSNSIHGVCTTSLPRSASLRASSKDKSATPASSILFPFLLPPSLLSRSSSLSQKSMASSSILAFHVVPPPLSLSRPTSPVGHPPLSEVRLRETLERASSPDRAPTRSGATSPPPRFTRVQTSPALLPAASSTGGSPRHPSRVHSGSAVPLASSPHSRPRNHQELYVTPPASYRDSSDPAYVNSIAYKRLEQTLCRSSTRKSSTTSARRPRSAGSQSQGGQFGSPLGRQNVDLAFTPESRTNSLESTEILTPASVYPYSQQQLTPPPSPPFNAQTAAKLCASIEGVVRFCDIEGLGGAEMLDVSDEEKAKDGDEKSKKPWSSWFWWNNSPTSPTSATLA